MLIVEQHNTLNPLHFFNAQAVHFFNFTLFLGSYHIFICFFYTYFDTVQLF